jgi:hypothetical protein
LIDEKNDIVVNNLNNFPLVEQKKVISVNGIHTSNSENKLPEILFITSYPPRECGIATYSQDLVKALNNKFDHSFTYQHLCVGL